MDDYEDETVEQPGRPGKKGNILPLWGNERTMNLNPLILTNIQSSHYFKVNLYELKTYHEVIDEIYYKVNHLEPWEKGSRKTGGQTGMCGGVRGVGAGGIVSTAYCLLYKLFTLRLTKKQLIGLINHADSPYIRGLGFMYIRYTQPPDSLYDWFDDYLEDEEVNLDNIGTVRTDLDSFIFNCPVWEFDVKAGGGQVMKVGEMLRTFLTKLDWFSTLFPRIPVPIQQKIEKRLNERFPPQKQPQERYREEKKFGKRQDERQPGRFVAEEERPKDVPHRDRSRSPQQFRGRDRDRDRHRGDRGERSSVSDRRDRDKDRVRHDHRESRDRERDRERDRDRHRNHGIRDFTDDLARERDRQRAHSKEHSHSYRHKHHHR